MKKTDELITEAHQNIQKDRQVLSKYLDDLVDLATKGEDPLAKVAMAEQIARLADGLTKSNAQLVELAKIATKKDLFCGKGDETEFDDEESEGIFDEIGEGFVREEEPDGGN